MSGRGESGNGELQADTDEVSLINQLTILGSLQMH